MAISERFCAGFALAATIARDARAEQARRGLGAELAPSLLATVRTLSALSRTERRERVHAWLRPSRSATQPAGMVWPSEPTYPLRAYALLAQGVAAQVVPEWVRTIPLPRAGYLPPPQLLTLLRRSATHMNMAT